MKGTAYHGWKFGLPDKFWPVTLDNFFDNPDEIREFGLRMLEVEKHPAEDGKWPGHRTVKLREVDEGLEQRITGKILSCYFNLNFEQIFWNMCDMKFQLIASLDKDKNNTKNKGWIHRDASNPLRPRVPHFEIPAMLAGLIYLTPDIEPDTGTSLFVAKKDKPLDDFEDTTEARMPLYKGDPVNDEEIKEQWEKHRSCFIEKIRFENIYNHLIMYDTKEFHAANNYYTPKNNRLTLTFFIGGIEANKWPMERVRDSETHTVSAMSIE